MKTFENFKIYESFSPTKDYINFLTDVGFFITLNTTHLSQYAIDAEKIKEMQQQFRKPVINGLKFSELLNDKLMNNPKAIPSILNWTKQLFEYIIPRFERYLNQEGKNRFLPRAIELKKRCDTIIKMA
jgi:hypothetical protein